MKYVFLFLSRLIIYVVVNLCTTLWNLNFKHWMTWERVREIIDLNT